MGLKRISSSRRVELDFGEGWADYSSHFENFSMKEKSDKHETTNYDTGNNKSYRLGLEDSALSVTYIRHSDLTLLDDKLRDARKTNGGEVNFRTRPYDDVIGPNNPQDEGVLLVEEFDPFGGKVGELEKFSYTWQVSGPVTRTVA